jgi:hypothetical protein
MEIVNFPTELPMVSSLVGYDMVTQPISESEGDTIQFSSEVSRKNLSVICCIQSMSYGYYDMKYCGDIKTFYN